MGVIYGESVVYTYESSGGISLFRTAPPGDEGIITGSGNTPGEGEEVAANHIRWWVLDNGDGTYQGGITGEGWYIEEIPFTIGTNIVYIHGPFYERGMTEAEIFAYAVKHENLNEFFQAWNSAHAQAGDSTISDFITYIHWGSKDPSCAVGGGVQS